MSLRFPSITRIGFAGAVVLSALVASGAQSTATPEQRTSREFDAIRNQPQRLLAFLQQMPKGGDLHNHLAGAVYAESFIRYAAANGQCINRALLQVVAAPCDPCPASAKPAASCAFQDQTFYDAIIDAWSMRNWKPGRESGHDHFFATFDKYIPAAAGHTGEMLAEVASRSAADHLQYLELMHTPDGMQAAVLGAAAEWSDDFAGQRNRLVAGIKSIVATTRKQMDDDETKMRAVLRCNTPQADPGCTVTVRYLYQ